MNLAVKTYTTGEIAKICGVNFRTVIRWIEKGYIEAYKLPGRGDNRVTEDSLVKFLKNNNMPIPSEIETVNKRVLVVDDDEKMARAISRTLKKAGFDTDIAHNGFIAGSKLEVFKPAVMTLDLKMPGISGLEVIHYVQNSEQLVNLKILVVSAQDQKELDEAVQKGASDALSKPFKNSELVARVSQLIGVN
ncbi:response regulator [Aliikangiella coralliicola]|uniref:Response regulator n=1 Tax=Aliikangiella coralliicola TaxID=2592383 RepID=A0A545UDQ3_9GAMM|nr:response regulator [Aliikangiella coralliicola]TQV87594.1 response regulator [Aliikangiella coralliicola]